MKLECPSQDYKELRKWGLGSEVLNKKPIEFAKFILANAASFGYKALKAFFVRDESVYDVCSYLGEETIEEILERLATACWKVASYNEMWLGDKLDETALVFVLDKTNTPRRHVKYVLNAFV